MASQRDERRTSEGEESTTLELIKRFFSEDEGADAAEYALVIGLVALAIVGGAFLLGNHLNTAFSNVANCVSNATGNPPTNC